MADEKPTQAQQILHDIKVINNQTQNDDSIDAKLLIYINLAIKAINLYIGHSSDSVPPELTGVLTELAQGKYIKSGYEGAQSVSEEGLSFTWSANDLSPFIALLDKYQRNLTGDKQQGSVMSWS